MGTRCFAHPTQVLYLIAPSYLSIGIDFMEEYGYTTLRGCLKRVVPGIVCHQEAAKTLNFEDISLQSRHNLRRSLAFQTPSNKNSILILKIGFNSENQLKNI
jgi:hypothetical protein